MKTMWKYLLLFTIANIAKQGIVQAQVNLVPNPSFEDTVACPYTVSQISRANGWMSFSASPDYYNACAGGAFVSVPNNLYGYQKAASGKAYSGIVTWDKNDTNSTAYEIIGIQLISNLSIGSKYYVSFKVSLTLENFESGYAINKLGAKFSTVPYSVSNPIPINNSAQIYTNTIITDTVNWTRVTGTFIADSTYKYISIGNFFDFIQTDTIAFNSNVSNSYHYIDDVCVSTDSAFAFNYTYTDVKEEKEFNPPSIFPNPANNYFTINPTNIFNFSFSLFDVTGVEIIKQQCKGETIIETSSFSNGIYILNIKTTNNSYNYKIIINH